MEEPSARLAHSELCFRSSHSFGPITLQLRPSGRGLFVFRARIGGFVGTPWRRRAIERKAGSSKGGFEWAAGAAVGETMGAEAASTELLSQINDILKYEDQATGEMKLELPAQVMAEHAVNTRKTQKLTCTQLQVLKFFLEFIHSAPRIQDASDSVLRKEMEEAKKQWKAHKADYQQEVEAIKREDVPEILAKQKELQSRARLLEEVLQRYRAKKEEVEEKARNAQKKHLKEQKLLRERQRQIEQQVAELQKELECLQREFAEQESHAGIWREKMRRVSDLRCLGEDLQGVKVNCVSENDMEVELAYHPQAEVSAAHSLKLRLHWGEDGSVTLQSDSPSFLLPGEIPLGTCNSLKGVLLELQHSYSQQAELLAEIEMLQNCFAIDWQPEKRLLMYLKPSSTCSLYVESGYPAKGRIRLISIKAQQGTVDVTSYKPPQKIPSLKSWLAYLSTMDFNTPIPT